MSVNLKRDCDFSGWAATNNVRCTDNTVIRPGAFAHNDGQTVPIVWQHNHNDISNLLGKAYIEDRSPKGTYMYGFFNNSEAGREAKEAVQHGDIKAISVFANRLTRKRNGDVDDILHGDIKEISLVLAAADPGAYIDYIKHSDGDSFDDSAIIYSGGDIFISHAATKGKKVKLEDDEDVEDQYEELEDEEDNSEEDDMRREDNYEYEDDMEEDTMDEEDAQEKKKKTMTHACGTKKKKSMSHEADGQSILDSMDETQQAFMKGLMAKAYQQGLEDAASKKPMKHSDEEYEEDYEEDSEEYETDEEIVEDEGEEDMGIRHDVFDNNTGYREDTLSHAQLDDICARARNDVRSFGGSFRDAFIAHAEGDYGIGNINLLFPDAKAINNEPEFIKRRTEWVAEVMNGTKHVPYTRIKSLLADITEEDARAKGYITGEKKKEEFFSLAKRETTPTTVYKKQKLDRDNILDATTINVVTWLWGEMSLMLEEELARAILIGDGRDASSKDKINEQNIRPIATDAELYTVAKKIVANVDTDPEDVIEEISKSYDEYEGTGTPTMFMTVAAHTAMLWAKDTLGRRLYESDTQLCSALRVAKIVEVPVFKNVTKAFSGRTDIADGNYKLLGVKVNLVDYAVGTDKGGEINKFDSFDIDYNQYKYLIETRCSGALVKYHGAQSFWTAQS